MSEQFVIDELSAVKVLGATFWFDIQWADYEAIQAQVANLPAGDIRAHVDLARETLTKYIVRVDGMVDRDGNPVEWSPELFGRLSPRQVKALIEAFGNIGDAENPTTDATSGEPAGS